QPGAYHHVPKEAAKQFTRTTTVGSMRDGSLAHRLSKHGLKFRQEGGSNTGLQQTDKQRDGFPLERSNNQAQNSRRQQQQQQQPSTTTSGGGGSGVGWRRNSTGNAAAAAADRP